MIDLHYWTTPNGHKVTMFLEETGLPYRVIPVDIGRGDQFDPKFLAIAPNNRIPAIVDHEPLEGGPTISLFESGAILLYLAEKTGRLLSTDPLIRAETLCWLFWQVANQGPMAGQAAHFVSHAPKQGIDNPYARGRYHAEVTRLYQVLDNRLRDHDYLAGDAYSIADIAAFPWTRVAGGHGITIADFPHVADWQSRIAARPAAKVKVSDPREQKALRHDYTPEQFQKLFRPEGSTA
jgi:GSH-dependent disulfide-bond oxidoreductase